MAYFLFLDHRPEWKHTGYHIHIFNFRKDMWLIANVLLKDVI